MSTNTSDQQEPLYIEELLLDAMEANLKLRELSWQFALYVGT